ncbi:unnamed protein product [Cylicocyclus nassatus]|uniref:Teneurin-like YD-shell domain-containing protein n=1 Tax=Cylicocyclus nassatus TaxID=53992 RepID=A0AA36DR35_CYLNA|nr:unnamed protein product [Cylicocyclus nassatus]
MNGVSALTVTFDRVTRSDVISAKSEDETLRLSYTDSGELESIAQEGVMDLEPAYRLANLSIHYDSLGKRNELIWGNRTTQVTYDRQNRIVERTVKGGVTAKFMYTKEIPFTKKALAAEDSDGKLLEWVTTDEQHHVLREYDQYGRVFRNMTNCLGQHRYER